MRATVEALEVKVLNLRSEMGVLREEVARLMWLLGHVGVIRGSLSWPTSGESILWSGF